VAQRVEVWRGPEPAVYPPLPCDTHGGGAWHGLWHQRQIEAWKRAWSSGLIEQVSYHGGDLYIVPSQTEKDQWYAIHRLPLAPDGYLYLCDCAAGERAGVVCAHGMAVYLWRLRHVLGWRLKKP
jgi:hypothetical protein